MLAGKMKLKQFLVIASVVGVAGIVGLYFACRNGDDTKQQSARKSNPTVERAQPRPALERPAVDKPAVDKPPPVVPDDGLRPVDRELMGWVGKNLGAKKKKDASKGRPYKINLYQDAGKNSVNRAKVDLDRDDKWDEKWTFDGTDISRKVAPADDESYSETYTWNGKEWVKA